MSLTNLPISLTTLLGREEESNAVHQILRQPDARLLTLTGPGGVGKTSLALKVAQDLQAEFKQGAYFVSLAPILDPTLVLPTLARDLGLAESPDRLLFDSLKDFLHDREMLLLLDNFEQIISAAPLLAELLLAAGHLKLMVTSREALRLRGEREFPLAPLKLSDHVQNPDHTPVERLLGYSSIALFVQRAQASQPDFQLTTDNAVAVAEICERLDGLPLAIELAAARIKLLSPKQMLERLQDSPLHLLTTGARDAPARQKTLRDTVQWSYDLLNPEEQRAFRWLSVFVGGCSLTAAEALLRTSNSHLSNDRSPTSNLNILTSLVDKNLLQRMGRDRDSRLGMLETIREFGLEGLERSGELELARSIHANYYLLLAEEAESYLTSSKQKMWLDLLGWDQDNFRAALRWGLERRKTPFILQLIGAFWQFWFMTGHWSEGRRWLDEAVSMAAEGEVDARLHAKALYAAAMLVHYQGDLARARKLCEYSVALYQELDDEEGLLTALLHLCRVLDYQADKEALQARVPEALALANTLPDVAVKAQAYVELSFILVDSVGSKEIIRHLELSERIYRSLDNPTGLALALFVYGEMMTAAGEIERAQALHEEAWRLAAEVGDHRLKMVFFFQQTSWNWQQGNYMAAREAFDRLITHQVNAGLTIGRLEVLADILYHQEQFVWAARVFGLAGKLPQSGLPERPRRRMSEKMRKTLSASRAEVRNRLDEEAFSRALKEGQAMSVSDLLDIPYPDSTDSSSQTISAPVIEPLTPRELDVLHLLAQDLSNPEIAEQLVISRRTVEAHLRTIYEKLEVKTRGSAVRVAREQDLLKD